MISKNKFVKYMKKIDRLKEKESRFGNALYTLTGEFSSNSFLLSEHANLILELLADVMNDNEEKWIEYYLYELGGKNEKEDCITHKDGSTYSLRNPKELYDYLVKFKL